MPGITKLLKQNYWSNFDFEKMRTALTAAGITSAPGNSKFKKGPRTKKRGVLVDQQLCQIIKNSIASQPAPVGKLHPYTKMAISAFKAVGMVPCDAQVVVHNAAKTLATAVDMTAYDKHGNPCLIELKCSSNYFYSSAISAMKNELHEWPNSIENQHTLQTLVTNAMFEQTYGLCPISYILRICDKGAYWTKVDTSLLPASVASVLARLSGARRAKQARKKVQPLKPTLKKPKVEKSQPKNKRQKKTG